jgi:hypothetical protein
MIFGGRRSLGLDAHLNGPTNAQKNVPSKCAVVCAVMRGCVVQVRRHRGEAGDAVTEQRRYLGEAERRCDGLAEVVVVVADGDEGAGLRSEGPLMRMVMQ